jgi:RsiW-degrading membrane proteinase PrsW (M82 family)
MDIKYILVIVTAVAIGVLYLIKIRRYDLYEKEPFYKLLIVSIIGGIFSIIITLYLYRFVEVEMNFIDAFIKVGLIEESSKLFALALIYFFIKDDFNEIVDGIIYITAISLGFAIFENISYAFRSHDPYMTLGFRSVLSVIGHISFSGYMGIAFYIHKQVKRNYIGLILSVALASLAHGLYDGVLFEHSLNYTFLLVYLVLIFLQIWFLRVALSFSKFKKDMSASLFKESGKSDTLYCCKCNCEIKCNEIAFWKIRGGICSYCSDYVFNFKNFKRIMRYFRPVIYYRRYFNKLRKFNKMITLDDNHGIIFCKKQKHISANINDMGRWLKEKNSEDKIRALRIPLIGLILRYIGLRHMV